MYRPKFLCSAASNLSFAELPLLKDNGQRIDRPVLLRVDSKAGHGVGKPIAKLVDDAVDVWSFLFWQLGVKL